MDVSTSTSQTHNWELLAQLALYGQHSTFERSLDTLVQQLAALLEAHLPHAWGVLVVANQADVPTWASWGLNHQDAARLIQRNGHLGEDQGVLYPIALSHEPVGHLLLPALSISDVPTDALYYQAVAAQLGLILQSSHYQHALDRSQVEDDQRRMKAQIVNCVSRCVLSTGSLTDLLERVYPCIAAFFASDHCQIAVYAPDYNEIRLFLEVQGPRRSLVTTPINPLPNRPLARVLHNVEPLLLPNEESVGGAWMGQPLLDSQQQIIGAVAIGRVGADGYQAHEQALFETMSQQLAIGIQNLQLQTTVDRQISQLGLLNRLSRVAGSSRDIASVYQAALDILVHVTGVDQSRLVMFDRQSGVGHIVAEYIPTNLPRQITIPMEDNPSLLWLREHLAPLVSHDAQNDPLFVRSHAVFRDLDLRSIALLPLFVNQELVGSISLDYVGRQGYFDSQQLEFCQTIANNAATVIEKDRLFVEAQSTAQAFELKVGELSTLLESAGILASLLRPEEVIKSLTDLVSRQLRVNSVALWTVQPDDTLMPMALYGLEASDPQRLRLPIGRGMTGNVAASGLPLIINDIAEYDREHHPNFFGASDQRMTSYMGVPIFYQDRVIGVLSVMSAERREFSSDEMLLLVGLAGQAAVALENARLFVEREQRIAQLTTINRISAAVNATFELDELLLTLHRGISEVIDTAWSFIGLYEEPRFDINDSMLRLRVMRQGSEARLCDELLVIDGRGLIDYTVLKCTPLLLQTPDELQAHVQDWHTLQDQLHLNTAELSALDTPFECWLSVPILQGDYVLGVINVQSSQAYAYDQDDLRFLSTIASQAAVAISNASLFSERERRLRELSILKDISGGIASTQNLQSVLEHLRHELAQTIDVSNCLIGLYDTQSDRLTVPVCYAGGSRQQIDPFRPGDNADGWAIRNHQPLLLHTREQSRQVGFADTALWMLAAKEPLPETVDETRLAQSLLVVPIISGDTVLGIIHLESATDYAFDQDDLRFVMTLANQMAVTISNIHLFMERERRIEELGTYNEIIRTLSATTSFEALPEMIYQQTSRLLDTSNFALALLDEDQHTIQFPLVYEKGNRYLLPDTSIRQHTTEGAYHYPAAPAEVSHWDAIRRLTRQVIETGEPVLVEGIETRHGEWVQKTDQAALDSSDSTSIPHVWLGVPLLSADKVLGVLAVQSYKTHTYSPDDLRLLSTIASSAAIVLENARLFAQISNLAAELETRVEQRTAELADANIQLLAEKERLEMLHTITLELTASLDLEEIISRALEMASTNLGVGRGSIMMRDPQSGSLVCRALLHEQGVVRNAHVPIAFEGGEGLSSWVIQHQESVCIADVRKDRRWVMEAGRADEVRSVVAVPLIAGDTTLGVLILSSPQVNYFTEAHSRLLSTIANEVAIAINNAQLYSYITEMATRLAELLEQQKEETSKSRSIFQSMTEGVIVFDSDQRIAVLNLAAEHMLGIVAGDVVDQSLSRLLHYGVTREQHKRSAAIYEALSTGLRIAKEREGIYSMSFDLKYPQQTIAVNLAPVSALDGSLYGDVAVLRDITPEIEADRAKNEFFSKVSHDLRTPLTPIKGFIDLLRLSIGDKLNEEQQGYLETVTKNINYLRHLIDDILDISRFEAGRLKLSFDQVDISSVIKSVVQTMSLQAEEKGMHVTVDLQPDLPLVQADEQRITQVVTNVFSNAIKYTFDEGDIEIRAFLNNANLLQVDVADTGVGMTPEQMQKLFRPFYRVDNPLSVRAGGTGLGLSIAKSLVEHHNGEMWVSSEPGKGSVFCFVLPLEQPEASTEADEDSE